jgi:arabinan endo-1,5-alpha-L-arabinosidase
MKSSAMKRISFTLVWLGLSAVLTLGELPTFALDGMIGIHDPSTVVQCDGSYYVFGTGRGISVLTSTNGFDWQHGGRVFEHVPDSVHQYCPKNDGQEVWAPDIIKLNGEYYLYYAISSWGQYVSAVGLLTNPTLDRNHPNYKWTDRGMVVHSSEGENLNAIDPGVCRTPDGTLWLCYGSYHGNIELVQLDPKTGLRSGTNSPVTIIASQSEAADIIYHDGYYFLFVNHGGCCQGTNSTYNIRVGRSQKITGPYLDKFGDNLVGGGGALFLAAEGNNIGPGHFGLLSDNGVEKFSCHYEGVIGRAGRSILDIRPLLWTLDGWPVAGKNLSGGPYQIRSQRTGNVLQVPATATNGTAAATARYLSRDDQKWTITPASGGFYKIVGVASGLALQPTAATVTAAPFSGTEQQLWKVDEIGDGSYRIVAKYGRMALSTSATRPQSGNWVGLMPFTGDADQRWIITEP